MASAEQHLLARIPSVEILLNEAQSQGWATAVPRRTLVEAVRAAVDGARDVLLRTADNDADAATLRQSILADAQQRVAAAAGPYYRKVINATGIILHTALGRAVLPASAIDQIAAELTGYSLLQADLASGQRSKRDGRIEGAASTAHRRRGRHGGEQQRRRHLDRPEYGRPRQGSHRFPRATGRDRRLVPPARRDGGQRRQAGRGGHDQQDARPRL